jgi:hypothetical protein
MTAYSTSSARNVRDGFRDLNFHQRMTTLDNFVRVAKRRACHGFKRSGSRLMSLDERTWGAQVAELVDALASGASDRKVVEVRVFSWAPCLTAST